MSDLSLQYKQFEEQARLLLTDTSVQQNTGLCDSFAIPQICQDPTHPLTDTKISASALLQQLYESENKQETLQNQTR